MTSVEILQKLTRIEEHAFKSAEAVGNRKIITRERMILNFINNCRGLIYRERGDATREAEEKHISVRQLDPDAWGAA